MTPERWQRAKELFTAAVVLPGDRRVKYLSTHCGNDVELKRAVQQLLNAHEQAHSFIEKPAIDFGFDGGTDEVDPLVGRTVGSYRITSFLADGGMGAVYRGVHLTLPRDVVIKVVRLSAFNSRAQAQLKARFRREAHVQSQLDHPNIVRVFEFYPSSEQDYLVMEYIAGLSVKQLLERQGALRAEVALDFLRQAVTALEYAHSSRFRDETGTMRQGIIHRDIKPANMLLDGMARLKLTDFGIVKLVGESSLTQTGSNPGTVEYMSPEQLRGKELDVRSDIYSLGVTMFEMLTGSLPFRSSQPGSDFEIRRGHLELEPPRITDRCPHLTNELAEIVSRALRKSPSERFQTAGELLEAIVDLATRAPIEEAGTALASQQVADKRIPDRNLPEETTRTLKLADTAMNEGNEDSSARPGEKLEPHSTVTIPSAPREATLSPLLRGLSRRARSVWIYALVAVAILILGVGAYRLRPSSPPVLPTAKVKILRYQVEFYSHETGIFTLRPTQLLRKGGNSIRLRFYPIQRMFVYVLSSKDQPVTRLTSLPNPRLNIKTNLMETGTDFLFPGDNLGLEPPVSLLIILSPEQLSTPKFLTLGYNHALTLEEQAELQALRRSLSKNNPETAIDGSESGAMSVVTVADPKSPTILDVTVNR